MSTHVLLEGFGYLASVLVAISLMMRSIVRLRWINLVGAACFTAYGILISAYPVAALNFAIVLINVYFLWKTHRTKEAFAVVEMPANSPYLAEFLRFHATDIRRFQPAFRFDPTATQHVLLALRDLVPAGAVCCSTSSPRPIAISGSATTSSTRDVTCFATLASTRWSHPPAAKGTPPTSVAWASGRLTRPSTGSILPRQTGLSVVTQVR
jgi:hypothetical protein